MECPALIEQSVVVNTKYEEYESLYGEYPTIIGRILQSKLLRLKLETNMCTCNECCYCSVNTMC